jgi:hypothetical protein
MQEKQLESTGIEDALKLVREVKKETAEFRKQFEKDWKEQDNFYYGKHHKTGEQHKTVKNHIFKIIEGEVPILTDSMPGVTILSDDENRQDDALVLEKSIKYVYHDQNLQLLLPTLVRSSLTSAPGYLYAFYDPDADQGDGKIRLKQLPWDSIYLDGNAQTIEESSQARIEISMRNGEIARMFPHKKDEILQVKGGNAAVHNDMDNENLETRDVSGSNAMMGTPKKHSSKDINVYVETWIKSFDLEDISPDETQAEIEKEQAQLQSGEAPDIKKWENHPAHFQAHKELENSLLAQLGLPPETKFEQAMQAVEMMAQNNPEMDVNNLLLSLRVTMNHNEEHKALMELNPEGKKPKYKDGWRLIKTFKDIVLYDGPNPEQSGEIPLVPFYCYKDMTIYGFSEVKNIIGPQKSLNEMDYKEFKGLKRVANPGWIADHESGVTADKLTNDDGIVVIKAKGTEVRRLEPGVVSNQLQNRREADRTAIEDISGVNEATQGRTPSPNASGAAISSLQNQAIGRIRLKDRFLQHYSMKRLSKIVASLIIGNWSTEKKLRLNTENSDNREIIYEPLKMADLSYKVEIAPGSMAGIDKEALNGFILSLFDRKVIDGKSLLTTTDFPKREILLKQFNEANDIAAQQKEIEAQMQELQKENLKLKALVDPNLLVSEEKKIVEQIGRDETMAQINAQGEQVPQQAPPQEMM